MVSCERGTKNLIVKENPKSIFPEKHIVQVLQLEMEHMVRLVSAAWECYNTKKKEMKLEFSTEFE